MDLIKQLREAVGANKLMENINMVNQMAKTVDSLRGLLKDNKVSQSVKDRIDGLMTLLRTKPNINGINHYFNHFLLQLDPDNQPPVLKELLEVYHERWKNIDRKTAKQAFDLIGFSDEPGILIHGADKSITSLFELLVVLELKANIYQSLSRPHKYGREQAAKIAEIGYDIELIDDHSIGTVLADVDYVLIGCELILPNYFIAKAGTQTLLAAAAHYKRPVYVLADSRRILNSKFFPQNVLNTMIGEGKLDANHIWDKAPEGVKINAFEKEQCPNYLVENFIFEDGIYSPEELKNQIDKVMVKKFF